MGVQLWMVILGFAFIIHAGYQILVEKRALQAELGPEAEGLSGIGVQSFLKIMLGAAMALWGSVGEFKSIRVGDGKRPRWESMHSRDGFQSYQTRAKHIRPILAGIPSVPDS
eukprot:TRINITY_DN36110_c0_g1_i1.p2 TRINITY_DN36110_c0_g1~~TRINITY_DN36110_c0_g1_i1.p2  ORF type:complete len:112 (+),score=28.80 TRINITY_DN36110_c0_g1_i1:104-439(+)